MEQQKIQAFLAAHYPLIGVLIASFMVAVSMAIYTNWDAQVEFEAVGNVLTQGFPFLSSGLMINQPPLGFYLSVPMFVIFGLSYQNGVYLTTLFGLGSVVLVYVLGTVLYGRRTGLVAASLFGLVPWHVYVSRIFLIDNQYLFFSLLFLVVGLLAVKRDSNRMVLAAGLFFALAFLIKLFAIFALVTLTAFIFLNRKNSSFKLTKRKILLFLLPALISQVIWFGGLANQNFFGVYLASDLTHPELVVNPALTFLPIVFSMSAGWFMFLAGFFSVIVAFFFRKSLMSFLRLDVVCLTTIAVIMGLDMLLVFGFHLKVPYVSAVKYNYLALPFFCLLAASIIDKGSFLLHGIEDTKKSRYLKPVFVGAGSVLLLASLVESTLYLNTWVDYAWFGVNTSIYYPFNLYSGLLSSDIVNPIHFAALALMIASILLHFIVRFLTRLIKGLQQR